ncbi:MAG: cytidine deaminase [Heliobacteriaceae bacterium]|jgi:cytidine deaminase|nr:cytidine deaminase [Heliobacteriaceae bacterium]
MDYEKLMEKAKEASTKAYCKYSDFPVGACILTKDGNAYTGCNFENASYGLSICAERSAAGAAIVNGERLFKAVAIYSPKMENCIPCGACRQVLSEFEAPEGTDIITYTQNGLRIYKLSELLPEGFKLVLD